MLSALLRSENPKQVFGIKVAWAYRQDFLIINFSSVQPALLMHFEGAL